MKLADVILLSFSLAFLIIGAHQFVTMGLGYAYWAVMLALIFFFIYNLRKRKS